MTVFSAVIGPGRRPGRAALEGRRAERDHDPVADASTRYSPTFFRSKTTRVAFFGCSCSPMRIWVTQSSPTFLFIGETLFSAPAMSTTRLLPSTRKYSCVSGAVALERDDQAVGCLLDVDRREGTRPGRAGATGAGCADGVGAWAGASGIAVGAGVAGTGAAAGVSATGGATAAGAGVTGARGGGRVGERGGRGNPTPPEAGCPAGRAVVAACSGRP